MASERGKERAILRAIRTPAIAQVLALTVIQAAVLWFLVEGEPDCVRLAAGASLLLIAGAVADMYGKAILQGQGRFTALNIVRPTTVTFALVGIVVLFATGDARLAPVAAVWVAATLAGGAVTLAVALAGPDRRGPRGARRARADGPLRPAGVLLGSASPIETFRVDQAAIGLATPGSGARTVRGGTVVHEPAGPDLPKRRDDHYRAVARTAARGSSDIWRFFWVSVARSRGSSSCCWSSGQASSCCSSSARTSRTPCR